LQCLFPAFAALIFWTTVLAVRPMNTILERIAATDEVRRLRALHPLSPT
jgi:hypothetical protein